MILIYNILLYKMNTNLNIETKTEYNNKTYFIHLKKNCINSIDDFINIKNLIDSNMSDDSYEFKILHNSDLDNISYKNIGKYLKSNKISKCCNSNCNSSIHQYTIFKQLDCGHRFHKECIDPILKNDRYKKCIKCNLEHITTNI